MSAITCTDQAARRIGELMLEEANENLKLRINITGGGCSGFQYGFAFVEKVGDDDDMTEKTITLPESKTVTIKILVDPLSLMYLSGAEVDYIENLQGARFTIKNPNAETTCSCGSSFSLDPKED
jgi:iron-sulfur cluster insertion protein